MAEVNVYYNADDVLDSMQDNWQEFRDVRKCISKYIVHNYSSIDPWSAWNIIRMPSDFLRGLDSFIRDSLITLQIEGEIEAKLEYDITATRMGKLIEKPVFLFRKMQYEPLKSEAHIAGTYQ